MPNTLSQTEVMSPTGPGACACVVALIPKLWLRSEMQPDYLLGRPVVVGLLDQWTKLFYSLTFSLTGTAWSTTALALETALADKVEYCAQNGVAISAEDWPVHFLPDRIVLDRGVHGLLDSSALTRVGITVAVAPPRRPDVKGILEQHFRVNGQPVHWSGTDVAADKNERCLPNGAALLTPREFQRALILAALSHNHGLLKDYRLTADMIVAGVQPRPIELLHWGLANCSGKFRSVPLSEARLSLLPRAAATVTAYGIHCNGLHFFCGPALREAWFERARRYGDWKVEVAYDPRLVDRIFVVPTKEISGFECRLTLADSRDAGSTWAEVEMRRKQQTKTDSNNG